MKKVFCVAVLLLVVVTGFSQSAPKFGESILFANRERVKVIMKENGFVSVETSVARCEELENVLCDVISGFSEWCGMCHIYFKKGENLPAFSNINLVSYENDYAAVNDWKKAGYAIFKSIPSENAHLLVKDRKGQKYSFVAKVQIFSMTEGTTVNTKILKILTP